MERARVAKGEKTRGKGGTEEAGGWGAKMGYKTRGLLSANIYTESTSLKRGEGHRVAGEKWEFTRRRKEIRTTA